MRIVYLAWCAVATGFLVTPASGQNGNPSPIALPGNATVVGYTESDEVTGKIVFSATDPQAAAPASAEPAPPAATAATPPPAANGPPADKPWTIPQLRGLDALGIKTTGWLEQGATFNSLNPSDRSNGPLATNDRSDDYQMNQLWLAFVRPVKTDGDGFDIGGRVDVVYGTDWRYGDSLGLESVINQRNDTYGLILPQFYLEIGWNDLTVKIGHYAACLGYELVPAPANFFYSHSYALGYSEPILETGVQADYKLSDNWSINAGLDTGWGMFEDNNDKPGFLGGLKWHSDNESTSLSYEIAAGPKDSAGQDQLYTYALVLKQKLSEKLLYVAQQNMGGAAGADPRTGGYARWYGLDQYLIYDLTPKLSVGTRVEFFRDEEGAAVAGIGNLNNGWMALPGFAGTFSEWTTGLNWRATPNLVVRPEARWDWYGGSENVKGQLPFGDGQHAGQFTFATDLVLTF
jgi:hypothetical protein